MESCRNLCFGQRGVIGGGGGGKKAESRKIGEIVSIACEEKHGKQGCLIASADLNIFAVISEESAKH